MAPPLKHRKLLGLEELSFDPGARNDYLTGFHKRKLQRKKHAQEEALKRERAERVETRKLLRQRRKADLENHVQQVNDMMKKTSSSKADVVIDTSSTESVHDSLDDKVIQTACEDLYVDEDEFALVTVESMDLTDDNVLGNNATKDGETANLMRHRSAKEQLGKTGIRKALKTEHPKRKKRKFRYEPRAERKASRDKQHVKNANAARARKGII